MRKALVIGIDNYPKAPLSGCVNDASAVAELLRANGDGSPNFDVSLQTNVATKAQLRGMVEDLFSGDADVALFYFSGHGSDQGYIITPDFQRNDMGISMSDLLAKANGSRCKNKIIILDCCFSGQLGENPVTQSNESTLGEGVTIMAASSRDETAKEQNGHGLFTNLFLQSLRGSAADITGRITPAGVYAFIDQSLGAWQQRPVFKTNISQFVSIREIEPRVSKSVLRKLRLYFTSPSAEFKLDPSFEFTNTPTYKHEIIGPYADENNVSIFRELQMFESVGLIEPVGEDHMYFAAMNSKSCRLTALGLHYWNLAKDSRF